MLYLASRSPRRKELLAQAGLSFRIYVPKAKELDAPKTTKNSPPSRIVRKISLWKARAAHQELRKRGIKKGLILSADTLVFQNGKVLGKPRHKQEATKMLRQLSGSWHQVYTAVTCVAFTNNEAKEKTIHVMSRVKFFPLQKDWIRWYIATGEPMDKAGAYGAQAHGAVFIQRFSGSYSNVVGLPLGESIRLLEKMSGSSRTKLLRARLPQKNR